MRTVLACVDLSAGTEAVLVCARSLGLPNGHVIVLHVADPEPDFIGYDVGPQSTRDAVANRLRDEHRRVQDLADSLASPGLTVTPLTVQGAVIERILEHAARLAVGLIVIGSKHRSTLADLIVGSALRGVLNAATIPVVVVPVRPSA
jgi:nucleotide-binding universal stress UspA family protein